MLSAVTVPDSHCGPVKTPGIVRRHPELRWLASVLLIVAGTAAVVTSVNGTFRDDPSLPATSPEQLVAKVRVPHVAGYSGTFVTHIAMSLPTTMLNALTDAVPVGGSLLHGSHTVRYWYGGIDRQRAAVVGLSDEQDVFRNGSDLLLWDTRTHTAQRSTLADTDSATLPLSVATPAALTPPQLAGRILELAGDDTDTTLRSGGLVADRQTYELVIHPDAAESRIAEIDIQIDGLQLVPLGVQIIARGTDPSRPAVDVSFNSITFAQPAAQNFAFTPPHDATLSTGAPLGQLSGLVDKLRLVGSSWLSTASLTTTPAAAKLLVYALGKQPARVHGTWGSGRLLQTKMICVLVTDAGRVVAGAVDPSVLYRAVGG